MFSARRSVVSARNFLRNQQPRRYDSHSAHHAPVNEGFGRSFYVTFGTFFGSYLIYRIYQSNSESGQGSWISNVISKWTPSEKLFEQRNAIHTVAIEKAAHDRHLFMAQGQRENVGVRNPEQLNASGPYNVPAGALADMSAVSAHYNRENQLAEEERVARMKEGKVVSLYD